MLFLLFTNFEAFATEVPQDKAKLVATNYLRHLTNQPLKRSGDFVKLVYTSKQPTTKRATSAPFFYVFNQVEGKGFIIVSGDDNIKPILGYSLESNFDQNNLSPQVAYWLSEYEKQISYVVESNIQNQLEKQEWEQISSNIFSRKRGTTAVKPLLKTTWNQNPYYNDQCPLDNGVRTVTGCTATTIAQTMKYWNYPSTGSGSHSYTAGNYGVQSANFGATTYDWENMPNNVNSPNSEVAKLMYHIGVSVEMKYGLASTGGSGAHLTYHSNYQPYKNGHLALQNFFKYDASTIESIFKENYSDQTWIDKIKSELLEARVVMFEGYSSDGKSGHAFVADGFDANNFIHFNWGWGGSYNGYFSITSLIPSGTGTGGGAGDYTSNQGAVIGIKPPTTNIPKADFSVSSEITSAGSVITLSDESTNYPNAWSWTISPNNATFVNGTSNTSKFPEVSFSTPGKYTITLISTNSMGSNTVSKTNYITVNPALTKQVCDTLTNFLSTEKKTYVPIKGGGSLAGHINGLIGFAELYTNYGSYTHISGALLDFARAETNNSTSTVKVNVYQNNNGSPGTVLSTKLIKIMDIKNDVANKVETKVIFDNPIAITGQFFIGIETTNALGDSVGLYTTSTSGVTTNTGFIKFSSNNSWCTYEQCWSGLKIHLKVLPLVATLPTANFVINTSPTQINTNIEIDASSSTDSYAYNWTLNGASISNSNYYKESITYATPGTYDIKLDAIGGCGNSVSITKQITVSGNCNSTPAKSTITKTESVSFTWNGSTYTQSGTYIYNTKTKNGCDSIATLILTITNPQNFTKTVIDTSSFFAFKRSYASPKSSGIALIPYYYANTAGDPSKDSVELTTAHQIIPNPTKSKVTYKGITMFLVSLNKLQGYANLNVNVLDVNGSILAKSSQKVLHSTTAYGAYNFMFDNPVTTTDDIYLSIEPSTTYDSVQVSTSGAYRNSSISCNITGNKLTLVSPAPATNLGTGFWSGQEITGNGIPAGTKITAVTAATSSTPTTYTISSTLSSALNDVVVTGINLTFDDFKYQGGMMYSKFPVISGTKNPDLTKTPVQQSDYLHWINIGTANATNWKSCDAHISLYPIVEYTYDVNPSIDNKCLGDNNVVNVTHSNSYFSIAKNPVLNKMAFWTRFLGYTKKNGFYYSRVNVTSGTFKDTLDDANQTFSYKYVANSDATNDTLVVLDYILPYGLYKSAPTVTNTTTVLLSSKMNITTSSVQASTGKADGKASVVVSGGISPYTYLWSNNQTKSEISVPKGDYKINVTDANGCTISGNVNVSETFIAPSTSTTYISSCNSFNWNGNNYTSSGKYTFNTKGVKGNDSIATLFLTINKPSTSSIILTTCGSYDWKGKTYSQSGKYDYVTKATNGCDSIITLDLTIKSPSSSTTIYSTVGSYTWNGVNYTQSGVYTFKTKNIQGCDSTATLLLTINSPGSSNTIITSCDSYMWNGTTYNQSGTYTFKTKNAKGNDSIATLLLTINNSIKTSITETSCERYTWNGKTYYQSGKYDFVSKTAKGCDSIVTLYLTIFSPSTSTTTYTTTGSYTWNGVSYNQSGIYTYKTKNKNGCDSTATLVLIINTPGTSTTIISACNSYLWNGVSYNQSGTYTFKTKNAKGNDSIATLLLTINKPTMSVINETACGSFSWNGKTYIQSGKYEFIAKNAKGCDSLVTLDLIINKQTNSNISASACGAYIWNEKTYTQSGKYEFVTKNVRGCDSIVTLDLTINPMPTLGIEKTNSTLISSQSNGLYQWFHCDSLNHVLPNSTDQKYTPTNTGNYAVKINLNGCIDTSSCIKFEKTTTMGIDTETENRISIYPNPNNGIFSVSGLKTGSYKIFDILGTEVYSFKIQTNEILQLDLSHLSKGVYHFTTEDAQKLNGKVVITD